MGDMTIPQRPHISFSQLSTYMRCSMQYYFRYVKGIIERPSLAPAIGNAGHLTLASNYTKKIATGEDLALPELLSQYSDNFDNETVKLEPEDIQPDEDLGTSKDHGVSIMKTFHRLVAPKIRPALVEWEFNIDLSDPEYEFPLRIANGRIDLITASEEIFDNKFVMSRRPKTQADVDLSPQLTLYETVFNKQFGHAPNNVGLMAFMPPGKKADTPPIIQTITRDPRLNTKTGRESRRARILHQLHMTEKEISLGIFKPVDDPRTCGWCGFRERCQFSLVRDDYTAMQIRQTTPPPKE